MQYYLAASTGCLKSLEALGPPKESDILWRNDLGETPVFAWVRSCSREPELTAGCIWLAHHGWSLRDVDGQEASPLHHVNQGSKSPHSLIVALHEPQPAQPIVVAKEPVYVETVSLERKQAKSASPIKEIQTETRRALLPDHIHLSLSNFIISNKGTFIVV